MKIGNRNLQSIVFCWTIAFLMIGVIGCKRQYIALDQSKYITSIPKTEYSMFQGKYVFLDSIENNADNTSLFYYYSMDEQTQYGGPVLASYLWYCLRDGLQSVGMGVFENNAPPGVNGLKISFVSLTDTRFDFVATLRKDGFMVLKKEYTAEIKPSDVKDSNQLEKQAYRMVDQVLMAMLNDTDFQKAFLNK